MRINLFLTKTLNISRRSADDYLKAGKIKINQKTAKLGEQIDPETDKISFENKVLKLVTTKKTTIALYKPKKYITTKNDPEGRGTVMDLLPEKFKDLKPIGRLDYESEGLLLLSDDGELIYRLTHPKFEKEKEYILDLKNEVTDKLIKLFLKGIKLKEGLAKADAVKKISDKKISVTLHQGYNRQLRRMTELCNNQVKNLKRVRMGNIELGSLKPGKWREINM
jgi:23S rRNA pseudouridine2605 synthase